MAWTTARTWATGELVTAAIMNTHVRDNLNALKDPPGDDVEITADITTSSTSFVDATGLTVTITTTGGEVVVGFTGTISVSTADRVRLRVGIDAAFSDILVEDSIATSSARGVNIIYRIAVSAGAHTFKLQWASVGGNTLTMLAASSYTAHFWAAEIS